MPLRNGFSLLETLVTLALVAGLLAAAVPVTRNLLLEARLTGAINSLVHAVHAARQSAHLLGRDVVICRSMDARQCAALGNWADGWISFVNRDGDDPPVVDAGEAILAVQRGSPTLTINSNRRAYVLRAFALRATNGTVVFCDERGGARARALIISYSGRPRLSQRTAADRPLGCPAR